MSHRPVMAETPERYRRFHMVLLAICTFFFAWLVIEGFLFLPWLLLRYGGQ